MNIEKEAYIKGKLEADGLHLSERLGQHFLVDQGAIDLFVASILPGAKVIEVGSGIGHITEALAQKASSVISIELDRRFLPTLEDVQARNPNIQFIIKDALYVPFNSLISKDEEAQVIGNIPFHITEPFVQKLIDMPISSAVLIVGENTARELQEPEDSLAFGKMSLLGQTFFDIRELARIPKDSFYPPPRTEASMIVLNPKGKEEIQGNSAAYIFASLFRKTGKHGLVKNDIKQAIVEAEERGGSRTLSKQEYHRKKRSNVKKELRQLLSDYREDGKLVVSENAVDGAYRNLALSQSQALGVIGKMGISQDILEKPFFRLDNRDIRELTTAVRNYYR